MPTMKSMIERRLSLLNPPFGAESALLIKVVFTRKFKDSQMVQQAKVKTIT